MSERDRERPGKTAGDVEDPKSEAAEASSDQRARLLHYRRALQRKASGAQVREGADAALARAESSTGAALPSGLAKRFERATGADLSGVRVHTGEHSAGAAEAVGARAYTTGQDVHFARGTYEPSTRGGQELIAHEVAHTIQQSRGAASLQLKPERGGDPGDVEEQQADDAAKKMVGDEDGDKAKKGGDATNKDNAANKDRDATNKDGDGDRSKGKELMPPLIEPPAWAKNPIVAPFGQAMSMYEKIADAYVHTVLFASDSVSTCLEDAKRTFGGMHARFSAMLPTMTAALNQLDAAIAKAEEDDKKQPSPTQQSTIADAKSWRSQLYWSIVKFAMGGPPRVDAEVGKVSKRVILSGSWEKMPQEILAAFTAGSPR